MQRLSVAVLVAAWSPYLQVLLVWNMWQHYIYWIVQITAALILRWGALSIRCCFRKFHPCWVFFFFFNIIFVFILNNIAVSVIVLILDVFDIYWIWEGQAHNLHWSIGDTMAALSYYTLGLIAGIGNIGPHVSAHASRYLGTCIKIFGHMHRDIWGHSSRYLGTCIEIFDPGISFCRIIHQIASSQTAITISGLK